MSLSLDNPYGNVTIPRAKLRAYDDASVVIVNPMAFDGGANRNATENPYANFKPQGEQGAPSSQGSSHYGQTSYTLKEDREEVSQGYICCRRCRRK